MLCSRRILLALLCYCAFLGTVAAVCSGGCGHGRCVTPGTCKCDRGWQGNRCNRDVNECEQDTHNCQQRCKNLIGSFSCYCNSGFYLALNGVSCGTIPVSIPGLEFTAVIKRQTSPPPVQLCMSTKQSWIISPYIEACNLFTCVALSPTPLPISGFSFKVDGKIGFRRCRRLEARAIVSYNPNNPSQSCFYMKMNMPLTMQSILNAFCFNIRLPSFIGDMRFLNGAAASYSAVDCYLQSLVMNISRGLYFKGTLSFWGLSVEAEVQYSPGPPNSFYTKFRLPLVRLFGDALIMSESRAVRNKGPFLEVSIGSSVSATASIFVSVLRISVEATLSIVGNNLTFSLSGSILGRFQARVSLSGEYKRDLSAMNFYIVAELQTDFFDVIINKVKSIASNIKKEADSILIPLQAALSAAQKVFDSAAKGVRNAADKVRGFESRVAGARREVERIRNKINSICHIRSCGKVSVSYPCGVSCSWRGGCKVKKCYKSITDPACIARNVGCRALKAPWEVLLRAAEATLRGFERALSGARGVLRGAESLLRSATSRLNDAKADLARAKSRLGSKLKVCAAIVHRGVDNLLEIHSATLEGMLDTVRGGKFVASIKMTIIGNWIQHRLTLTLLNPIELADYVINYIRSRFRIGRKRRSGLEIGTEENKLAELREMYGSGFPFIDK